MNDAHRAYLERSRPAAAKCAAEGCDDPLEPDFIFCKHHATLIALGAGEKATTWVKLDQSFVTPKMRAVTRPCSFCTTGIARWYVTLPRDSAWGESAGVTVQVCDDDVERARNTPGIGAIVPMPRTVDEALIEIERQAMERREREKRIAGDTRC